MSRATAFKTPGGEAAYLAAYDAALRLWPVGYEEIDIPVRFGVTHVVVSGPKDGQPLVLLHGYLATSVMWGPNIADFSRDHRVYAIDVMGQPSKSIPGEPIGGVGDYVAWLTEALEALHLDRVSLLGMSFGGWLALTYAAAVPDRVEGLALLSPGGLLPLARQFRLRGMLMVFFPTRLTVSSLMGWMGFEDTSSDLSPRPLFELMYLGIRHFRMPRETARVVPDPLSDDALRALRVPVLVLLGDQEVLYDPARALDRARRLIPDFQGELVPGCSHEMCFSQHRIVNARVLGFLAAMPCRAGGPRLPRTEHTAVVSDSRAPAGTPAGQSPSSA